MALRWQYSARRPLANTKSALAATHMSDWPSPITSTRLPLGVDLHLQLPDAARQASLACGKSMRQLCWSTWRRRLARIGSRLT